jgi:hypothetical protein
VSPPFFFNGQGFLRREGTQAANLLVDLYQFLGQGLKAAELGNFPFRFA